MLRGLVAVHFLSCLLCATSWGDEPESETTAQSVANPASKDQANRSTAAETNRRSQTSNDPQRDEKQKKALAGFMMLSLVCGVFLFLVVAIAIVSHRFRKSARQGLPDSLNHDPLWYLRNKSDVVDSDVEISGSSQADG